MVSSGSEGVAMTRARKRKVSERDSLWDVVVNNDDICFKHILPRLNRTNVKFLYEVNTETRKLIKRSTREGQLKDKFEVREMSLISTLEVAWENRSLWPRDWEDETYFCRRVAETNKLELLKWAREEKKCKWDKWTINRAASQGNLEMVQYCVAKKCPGDEYACENAALHGHLEVLKYLHEEVKVPWDSWTADRAADNGHLHILEYLVERKYDDYSEYACGYAAGKGQLDCLKYLHETAKAPWDSRVVFWAQRNNQPECLQYLLDNNCPLPYGWRYEGGVLRTL
jgi:RNAse (barnase) inhibitor barstar